jgi:hypothetical protein
LKTCWNHYEGLNSYRRPGRKVIRGENRAGVARAILLRNVYFDERPALLVPQLKVKAQEAIEEVFGTHDDCHCPPAFHDQERRQNHCAGERAGR